MTPEGSITRQLGPLKAGDDAAIQAVWERYFSRLVGLARKKLGGRAGGVADEEDAAISAFDSFCRAAEAGRFPRLNDRDDLWHVLVTITARKAANVVRHENAGKRGGGAPPGDEALADAIAGEPDPAFAAEAAEQCRHLLAVLGDEELRSVAVWKMEGHTNEEIAVKLNRSVGSVERKLRLIRCLWEKELHGE